MQLHVLVPLWQKFPPLRHEDSNKHKGLGISLSKPKFMLFDTINIKDELVRERGAGTVEEHILSGAVELLERSREDDALILERLRKGGRNLTGTVDIQIPDGSNAVFDLNAIRKVCLNYRLRFLSTKYFSGNYPYETILRIRAFEKKYKMKADDLMIIAPTKMFRLIDPDKDPLLFASLGNGKYYLLHQWGNDLSWYRKLIAWPVRNFKNLATSIFSFILVLTLALPTQLLLAKDVSPVLSYNVRIFFFFLSTLASIHILLRLWLRGNKNLSEMEWDSKFLH